MRSRVSEGDSDLQHRPHDARVHSGAARKVSGCSVGTAVLMSAYPADRRVETEVCDQLQLAACGVVRGAQPVDATAEFVVREDRQLRREAAIDWPGGASLQRLGG